MLHPHSAEVYTSAHVQGQTVRRSNGCSLAYVRIGAKLPAALSSPEGVCFSKHSMYVVRWVQYPKSCAQQRATFLQTQGPGLLDHYLLCLLLAAVQGQLPLHASHGWRRAGSLLLWPRYWTSWSMACSLDVPRCPGK